jgi:cobalt-zinc-cadmium resistance protein CzcA
MHGRDLVGFVEEAKARIANSVRLPSGYRMAWGGQFENQQRAAARLAVVVPVALALIFLLLFSTLHSVRQAALVREYSVCPDRRWLRWRPAASSCPSPLQWALSP